MDEYRFPGFRPLTAVKGKFGDNKARVIQLARLQKKPHAAAAERSAKVSTTGKQKMSGICPAAMPEFISPWRRGGLTV
jgi:hypothetical protein